MVDLRFRLKIFIGILIVVMVLGILGFMFLENLSLVDAVYFSIVTIATVGYGDIHPSTGAGKALAIILIICGVGTFLGVVANATEIMMNRRERKNRREKTNVVLGAFFSETGTRLLTLFSALDGTSETLCESLRLDGSWTKKDFSDANIRIKQYDFKVDSGCGDLDRLYRLLEAKGDSLLRLLENPALMEHENFTELLQAILHLRAELLLRDDLSDLPESDCQHLSGDIQRAYRQLVFQWIDYMKYLKNSYPYMFHLAVRSNPFDPEASPVVLQ